VNTPERRVDVSSAAIDRRLRDVAQLHRLGLSLRRARYLGKVEGASKDGRVQVDADRAVVRAEDVAVDPGPPDERDGPR